MTRIAVVGSRAYPRLDLVEELVRGFPPGTVLISGGAVGVDEKAEEVARAVGLTGVIYLADWTTHGKKAGLIRNTWIVLDADEIVAFWDGKSRGTRDTIRKARATSKLVTVFGPDGEVWL